MPRYVLIKSKRCSSTDTKFHEELLADLSRSQKKISLVSLSDRPTCSDDFAPGRLRNFLSVFFGLPARKPQKSFESLSILKTLFPNDLVIFTGVHIADLEEIFQLLPQLELTSPLKLKAVFFLAQNPFTDPDYDETTLALRLKSGSPFEYLYFCSTKKLNTDTLGFLKAEVFGIGSDASKAHLFISTLENAKPSLVVKSLGPLAILLSPFWGRVGSTSVFDSQLRALLQQGFVVVRIFYEHWPDFDSKRRDKFMKENLEFVRPHISTIVARDCTERYLSKLSTKKDFSEASPVLKIALIFSKPVIFDETLVKWAGSRATLSVVNHVPHVHFVKSIACAPIILETHDIFSELLAVHGVPSFVPNSSDSLSVRMREEAHIWQSVAACVNLSVADHKVVTKYCDNSVFIRPYAARRSLKKRPWDEVVRINDLPSSFEQVKEFDLMFWGDRHQGNVIGVQWFFDNVIPDFPQLELLKILIVGRVSLGLPKNILQRKNVYVTGFVDRLDDFISRSKVLVIPDQVGTGTSIKLIEAAAFGAPFACTANGARSLNTNTSSIPFADTPKALGKDILYLLGSPAVRRKRAELSRQFYDINFSEELYNRKWQQLIHNILNNHD